MQNSYLVFMSFLCSTLQAIKGRFFQLPFVVQINPEGQSLRTRHNLLAP